MIFKVKQTFPLERVFFESNSEIEAVDYIDNLILLGGGWFELWEDGYDVPIQAGGEQAFSPYHLTRLDLLDVIAIMKKTLRKNPRTSVESKRSQYSNKIHIHH